MAVPLSAPALLDAEAAMLAHDGARLGLTVWSPEDRAAHQDVIVGIHGMNNYAGEFRLAAPEWAKAGVPVYAYDQRGFGRSAGRGRWPDEELMREDLRTAVGLARARHPEARVTVVAISMGAAVAITAFASSRPPAADRLILSGPGLLGWPEMKPARAASLKFSAKLVPALVVQSSKFAVPVITDNRDFLALQHADPLVTRTNRIDQLFGVVSLMDTAQAQIAGLPGHVPTLISYGARDDVIPESGPRRAARSLPPHARTVYYEDGYHILLSDIQRQNVIADYLAFLRDPEGARPSGAPEWPFR